MKAFSRIFSKRKKAETVEPEADEEICLTDSGLISSNVSGYFQVKNNI